MKQNFLIEVVEASLGKEGWTTDAPQAFAVEDDGFVPMRADVKRSVVDGFEVDDRGGVVRTEDAIAQRIKLKLDYSEDDIITIAAKLRRFLIALGLEAGKDLYGVERLKGLKVLDLGCGNDSIEYKGMFSPWLCRGLYAMGADVTGVDKIEVEDEWNFKKIDLTKQGALEVFDNNSFDVVHMRFVLGHREGELATDFRMFWPYESLGLDDPIYKACEDEIFNQVLRILKPGGLFIVNGVKYRKVGETVLFKFEDVSRGSEKVQLPYVFIDDSFLLTRQ